MLALATTIVGLLILASFGLILFGLFLFTTEKVLGRGAVGVPGKFVLLTAKSLRRNPLRTSLTYMVVFVLVVVVTLVWSILVYLDDLMTEKTSNIKVIVTEKWSASGAMPFAYAAPLAEGAADSSRQGDIRPMDSMTWQFYVGTLDAVKKTRENSMFLIALEPAKVISMMNELLEEITPAQRGQGLSQAQIDELHAAVARMQRTKQGIIIGRNRLAAIQKRVGDRFTLSGGNYTGLDLEFEIVGVLPESGRYDETAFMNRDYLNDAIEAYPKTHGGSKHPLADRTLNLIWLKVADQADYGRIAWQIESSGSFRNPAVKCETLSSAITTVMESYRDLVFWMRWLLSPAVLVTMALVVANAISLSVRERRKELAVMKVLGFRPSQILGLVLGEAVLIGAVSGMFSTGMVYVMVNGLLRTVNPLPMAIPGSALWWGPVLGGGTALVGSLVPAVQACRVRVSEVFARVT